MSLVYLTGKYRVIKRKFSLFFFFFLTKGFGPSCWFILEYFESDLSLKKSFLHFPPTKCKIKFEISKSKFLNCWENEMPAPIEVGKLRKTCKFVFCVRIHFIFLSQIWCGEFFLEYSLKYGLKEWEFFFNTQNLFFMWRY